MDLTSICKKPIGDPPKAVNIRYEPEFDELQQEIEKLSVPTASSGVDWRKVASLACAILDGKSKDILVASYLAVSLVHNTGMEGFRAGLRLYHDFLVQFWDVLFPEKKSMRGRRSAVEWWVEKTSSALAQVSAPSAEPAMISEMKGSLEGIGAILQREMEEPPALAPLQAFLESISIPEPPQEKKPGAAEKAAAAESEQAQGSAALPAPGITEPALPPDPLKAMRFCIQKIQELSTTLLPSNPADPLAYRAGRVAAWVQMKSLPPESGGRTKIPAPTPAERRSAGAVNRDDPVAGITSIEKQLRRFPFWLDLNRFAVETLQELGNGCREAREAVGQETAFLLHRLPGLESLLFSDGTPFADAKTIHWIGTISLHGGSTRCEPVTEDQQGSTFTFDESSIKAQAQLFQRDHNLEEALRSLQEKMRSSCSGRELFFWRLVLCQTLHGYGSLELLTPHLEQVVADLQEYRVEEWEPELALIGLKFAWSGLRSQPDSQARGKAVDLMRRIGSIDLIEALRLGKRG